MKPAPQNIINSPERFADKREQRLTDGRSQKQVTNEIEFSPSVYS
jgi:hypothetical protein